MFCHWCCSIIFRSETSFLPRNYLVIIEQCSHFQSIQKNRWSVRIRRNFRIFLKIQLKDKASLIVNMIQYSTSSLLCTTRGLYVILNVLKCIAQLMRSVLTITKYVRVAVSSIGDEEYIIHKFTVSYAIVNNVHCTELKHRQWRKQIRKDSQHLRWMLIDDPVEYLGEKE